LPAPALTKLDAALSQTLAHAAEIHRAEGDMIEIAGILRSPTSDVPWLFGTRCASGFSPAYLGGAATTWPLAARAQQGERIRRIGVLMNTAATIRRDKPASWRSLRRWRT